MAAEQLHDIKPLPAFSPFPWQTLGIVTACLLALLALYRFLRNRKRAPVALPTLPPLPADERAFAALALVEQQRAEGRLDARPFALAISELLREYLGQVLAIPAVDQTAREVSSSLSSALHKEFPTRDGDFHLKFVTDTELLLRCCEELAFSDTTTLAAAEQRRDPLELVRNTREQIRTLSAALKREAIRRQTVVAEHTRPLPAARPVPGDRSDAA